MPILDEHDLEEINASLQALNEVKGDIERSKEAGIDVATEEKALLDGESRLLQIKRAFFPGA